MPDDKMRQYSPSWSDDQVTEWDHNFRDDGALFLICSERDVEIAEYRDRIQSDTAGKTLSRPTNGLTEHDR